MKRFVLLILMVVVAAAAGCSQQPVVFETRLPGLYTELEKEAGIGANLIDEIGIYGIDQSYIYATQDLPQGPNPQGFCYLLYKRVSGPDEGRVFQKRLFQQKKLEAFLESQWVYREQLPKDFWQ